MLKADSAFWAAPDSNGADLTAMKSAFDGVAKVLFDAGILTVQIIREEIPLLVWDSAIAGGWYRFASETPARIFPEQLGHYYVWRDEAKDWKGLFRAETAKWLAALLEVSPQAPAQAVPDSEDLPAATAGTTLTDEEAPQSEAPNPLKHQKTAAGPGEPPRKPRARKSRFSTEQLEKARHMKVAGKTNHEIAKVLYGPNPTDAQRRSVPTTLKHHFGSNYRVEE